MLFEVREVERVEREVPYKIIKHAGKRPWMIVELLSKGLTKTVGSSVSKKNAEASIRARYAHEKR